MAVTLNARPRSERGKNAARALRRTGRVPAVVYGHGEQTRELSIDGHELEKLLTSISVENTLIELAVEGAEPARALIREVQRHPFKPIVFHVDLYQVHAGETLRLHVPVRLHGTPVGVSDDGGVLQQVLHDLEIECLPRDIPEGVDVEVGELRIGDSVHVRDVSLPNVKILNDEDLTICSVTQPTIEALPETPEEEEGVGGDVEPELVRRRGEDAADVETTEQGPTT
ncbi:MAG TPA: 50S ribosomal protein L25 [Longimicrobiaceae bacterium]|nr:50S ribosomal protein L25 [Longimicrobiaceae bacterium]